MRHHSLPALVIVVALAACSSTPADTSGEPTTPPTDQPDTVTSDASTTDAPDTTDAPETTDAPQTTAEPDTTAPPAPDTTAPPAPAGDAVRGIADQAEQPHGTNVVTSSLGHSETVDSVRAAIEGNDALTLVAEIDHAANAANVGLELPETTVFLFGNPALGTLLMQENRQAAIDLPQRMLVTTEPDGATQIWWNDPDFVASRHGLGPASVESLATIGGALATIATGAAGTDEAPTEAFPTLGVGDGVVTVDATGTFDEVLSRLTAAIEANGALTLVATVDHAANAESAGLELPPTATVVFGNPNLGTPLMRESRTFGLDLPQKMTILETDEGVQILYNDPTEFATRHDVDLDAEPIPTIAGALDGLAATAAGG